MASTLYLDTQTKELFIFTNNEYCIDCATIYNLWTNKTRIKSARKPRRITKLYALTIPPLSSPYRLKRDRI